MCKLLIHEKDNLPCNTLGKFNFKYFKNNPSIVKMKLKTHFPHPNKLNASKDISLLQNKLYATTN